MLTEHIKTAKTIFFAFATQFAFANPNFIANYALDQVREIPKTANTAGETFEIQQQEGEIFFEHNGIGFKMPADLLKRQNFFAEQTGNVLTLWKLEFNKELCEPKFHQNGWSFIKAEFEYDRNKNPNALLDEYLKLTKTSFLEDPKNKNFLTVNLYFHNVNDIITNAITDENKEEADCSLNLILDHLNEGKPLSSKIKDFSLNITTIATLFVKAQLAGKLDELLDKGEFIYKHMYTGFGGSMYSFFLLKKFQNLGDSETQAQIADQIYKNKNRLNDLDIILIQNKEKVKEMSRKSYSQESKQKSSRVLMIDENGIIHPATN